MEMVWRRYGDKLILLAQLLTTRSITMDRTGHRQATPGAGGISPIAATTEPLGGWVTD